MPAPHCVTIAGAGFAVSEGRNTGFDQAGAAAPVSP